MVSLAFFNVHSHSALSCSGRAAKPSEPATPAPGSPAAVAIGSRGLVSRAVQALKTILQDFSFWARNILGKVTAEEMKGLDSTKLRTINPSILGKMPTEDARGLLAHIAEKGDDYVTALLPSVKKLKAEKFFDLVDVTTVSYFEKLADTNAGEFKELTLIMAGHTLMHVALSEGNADHLKALLPLLRNLAKENPDTLMAIMLSKDLNGCTPIHYIIQNEDAMEAFLPALDVLGDTDLDGLKKMMTVKNSYSYTPLHVALEKNIDYFKALVPLLRNLANASPDTFMAIMLTKDRNGRTPIHYAMDNEVAIEAFLNVLEVLEETDSGGFPAWLKKMMTVNDAYSRTPMYAALERSADHFKALLPLLRNLAKENPDTLMAIMLSKGLTGRTPIHYAMDNETSIEAFLHVLEVLEETDSDGFPVRIKTMMMVKDVHSRTPIHHAMENEAAMEALRPVLKGL